MANLIKTTVKPKQSETISVEVDEETKKVLIALKSKNTKEIKLSISWVVEGEVITSKDFSLEELPAEAQAVTDTMKLNILNESKTKNAEVIGSTRQIK